MLLRAGRPHPRLVVLCLVATGLAVGISASVPSVSWASYGCGSFKIPL